MLALISRLFSPQASIPRGKAALLADTLFCHLFDDVCAGKRPSAPALSNEALSCGRFQAFHTLRSREQALVLLEDGAWIGTLVLHRGGPEPLGFPTFSHTTPEPGQTALDRLVDAALVFARADAHTRGATNRFLDVLLAHAFGPSPASASPRAA